MLNSFSKINMQNLKRDEKLFDVQSLTRVSLKNQFEDSSTYNSMTLREGNVSMLAC
jgi:hypothetical protein